MLGVYLWALELPPEQFLFCIFKRSGLSKLQHFYGGRQDLDCTIAHLRVQNKISRLRSQVLLDDTYQMHLNLLFLALHIYALQGPHLCLLQFEPRNLLHLPQPSMHGKKCLSRGLQESKLQTCDISVHFHEELQ